MLVSSLHKPATLKKIKNGSKYKAIAVCSQLIFKKLSVMKKIISYVAAIVLTTSIITLPGCKKETETPQTSDCKTCKALATATKPEVSAEVCTAEAEQTFRSQHLEQEISCR